MAKNEFADAINPFADAVNPFESGADFSDAVNPFEGAVNPFESTPVDPTDSWDEPPSYLDSVKNVISGYGTALSGGAKQTAGAIGNTVDVYSGDNQGVLEQSKKDALIEKTPDQKAFSKAIQSHKTTADEGIVDGLKNVFTAAAEHPMGAAHEVLAQMPNSGVALGSMAAGAAAGSVFGPVGTVVGGVVGMFAANTGLETGFRAGELASDGEFTDQESSEAARQGAIKGGVITGVDVATLGLSKLIIGAPGRAVERAVTESLVRSGVDVADTAAVKIALETPEILQAATEAGSRAMASSMSAGKRAGRGAAAFSLEGLGEGTGEYFGSKAAGLEASPTEAVMEGLMSTPFSLSELYVAKKLDESTIGQNTGLTREGIQSDIDRMAAQAATDAKAKGGDNLDAMLAQNQVYWNNPIPTDTWEPPPPPSGPNAPINYNPYQPTMQPLGESAYETIGPDGQTMVPMQGSGQIEGIDYAPSANDDSGLTLAPLDQVATQSTQLPDNTIDFQPAKPSPIDEKSSAIEQAMADYQRQKDEESYQTLIGPDGERVDPALIDSAPPTKPALQEVHEAVRVGLEAQLKFATQKSGPTVANNNRNKNALPMQDRELLHAIASMGGLNREEAQAQGIDPAEFNRREGGIALVFKNGGKSFDEMAEALSQHGFFGGDPYSANSLLDKVVKSLSGNQVYSPSSGSAADRQANQAQAEQIEQAIAKFEQDSYEDQDDLPKGPLFNSGNEEERRVGYAILEAELAGVDDFVVDYILDAGLSDTETEEALKGAVTRAKEFWRGLYGPKNPAPGNSEGNPAAPRGPGVAQEGGQQTTQQVTGSSSAEVAPSPATDSGVVVGRDEKYGIDVEWEKGPNQHTVRNSDPNSKDKVFVSGSGGITEGSGKNTRILNEEGEFVPATEINQAGHEIDTSKKPFKGTREQNKKALSLAAEIAFANETGDRAKADSLSNELYDLVSGRATDGFSLSQETEAQRAEREQAPKTDTAPAVPDPENFTLSTGTGTAGEQLAPSTGTQSDLLGGGFATRGEAKQEVATTKLSDTDDKAIGIDAAAQYQPAETPSKSNEAWRNIRLGRTEITGHQQQLVDYINEAKEAGISTYRGMLEHINREHPGFFPENKENGIDGGANHTEVANAHEYIVSETKKGNDKKAAAVLSQYQPGTKIGAITPNTGKRLSGVVVESIASDGSYVLAATAGNQKVEITLSPSSLLRAIERAQPELAGQLSANAAAFTENDAKQTNRAKLDAAAEKQAKAKAERELADTMLTEEYEDENGNTVTVEQSALTKLRQLTKRIEICDQLLGCLKT